MRMAEVKWTRGFSRLYLVAVVVVYWGYWLVWLPFQDIQSSRQQGDWSANFPSEWAHMFRDMMSNPGSVVILFLVPPVVGYGILLGMLATVRWILRGFLPSNPPKT